MYREYQTWVRVTIEPGEALIWVLYSYLREGEIPEITAGAGGAKIALGDQIDEIVFERDGKISLLRSGRESLPGD